MHKASATKRQGGVGVTAVELPEKIFAVLANTDKGMRASDLAHGLGVEERAIRAAIKDDARFEVVGPGWVRLVAPGNSGNLKKPAPRKDPYDVVDCAVALADHVRPGGARAAAKDDFLRRAKQMPEGKSIAYRCTPGEKGKQAYQRLRCWLIDAKLAKGYTCHRSADDRTVYVLRVGVGA